MSLHPTNDRLAEFAWDALEGAEADSVERHVAECALCALRVERVRAEARRISAALETSVPEGLSARILDAATPAAPSAGGGFRFAPWLGVAAAALFATAAAWAMHERSDALSRLSRIEKELASRPAPVPVVANQPDEMADILRQMARDNVAGDVAVMVDTRHLPAGAAEEAKRELLAAADTTSEMLAALAHGRIDFDALETTDTLADLNNVDLHALDHEDWTALVAGIERRSRADAIAAARSLVGDLQAAAGLDQTQASNLETYIVDKTAWRRDFHFLSDAARRELVARLIGFGGKLRPGAESLLNQQQKSSVLNYLESSETERKRYWENLRKTH
ncbi:MAG: hypothetical protein K8T20_09220 [Planctomycetes bacterium]|nr:hypothetical protein [Planctomycetota bacterium]